MQKVKPLKNMRLMYYFYKILYILPYVGLAVFIVRIYIMKKAPVPTPKGKKLTDELLSECVNQLTKELRVKFNEYTVDSSVMAELLNDNRNPDALRHLLNDICAHVGFNGDMFSLKIINAVVSDKAGEIRTGLGNTVITLEIREEYDTDTIISILAHEVMHQLLYLKGISRRDAWENEILTDTAVVYTGFYTYMYRGYGIKHGVNPFAYSKVGYISQKDINYIQDYIDRRRREH